MKPSKRSEQPPSCSLIIVAYNAARHLPACLDSLVELDYPPDRWELIVVDNGSTDATLELLARDYPWARVLPQERNLGFAEANNVGVAASEADCVAMINADMHFPCDWLREMVAAWTPEAGVGAVSSLILDWEGERVDFAGGLLNWAGHGNQFGYGRLVEDVHVEDGLELLFPCGGAMLVGRELFEDVGGFDPTYFIYFEDVDLGWRLHLYGRRTVLAAKAKAFHRGHGTTSDFRAFQVKLLYERNSLRTLIKNLGDEALERVLPAALLLMLERTRMLVPDEGDVPRLGLAHLHALSDVVGEIGDLLERRRAIQARRVVGDDEIFPLFRRPFQSAPRDDTPYLERLVRVVHGFRLDRVFDHRPASRVLVVAYGPVGERMSGPGIRSWEIARALSRSVAVTVASEWEVGRAADGVEAVRFETEDELLALVREADVVIVQGHLVERFPGLAQVGAVKIVDLYDPWIFENLENQRAHDHLTADWVVRRDVDVQRELLDVGDVFVCASERQRDYWRGMLAARGRAGTDVAVVSYGCPEEAPMHTPVLKGVHPQVPADAFLVLWGGGAWDWFDPLAVLDAFARLHAGAPEARLYFMGLELGDSNTQPQRVAAELRARAEELGLAGTSVLFGDWVPYDERGAYLLEADVGVIATRPLAEIRLAFRSRLLDHFWAGLPTVMTGGDVLSELVSRERAGLVCDPGDVDALATALTRFRDDPVERAELAANAAQLALRYRWSNAVAPLRPVVERPWEWLDGRRAGPRSASLAADAARLVTRQRFPEQIAISDP